MLIIEIIIAIFLVAAFLHFKMTKRKLNFKTALLTNSLVASDEIKRTLAMGLYLRFRREDEKDAHDFNENTIFIKQDPIAFETFIAEVFESARGGNTWVSPPSDDFGVDVEYNIGSNKYLGQVKCEKNDISFDPIAILHSNMVKQNAKGGYVITTSAFTKAAKQYAEGLDIELVDGMRLVDLWLDGIKKDEKEIKSLYS